MTVWVREAKATTECPTVSVLDDAKSDLRVEQVESNKVLVDWSKLWSFVEWSECFSKVSIVVNENDEKLINVENVSAKSHVVEVTPCEEVRFEVEVTLRGQDQELRVKSLRSEAAFKTYLPPKPKENVSVELGRHQDPNGVIDVTKADLKVKFEDLVDDPGCHKVTGAELRYRGLTLKPWTMMMMLTSTSGPSWRRPTCSALGNGPLRAWIRSVRPISLPSCCLEHPEPTPPWFVLAPWSRQVVSCWKSLDSRSSCPVPDQSRSRQ